MDRETYDRDRMKLVAKLERAKQQVNRLEEAIQGFDAAFKLIGERGDASKAKAVKTVESVARTMQDEFGVKEIQAVLEARHPEVKAARSTISGVLAELVEKREASLVERGQGRQPNRYRMRREHQEPDDDSLRIAV
ncbi:MAG: hypothetical protein AAGI68_14075 [Planctomycetota bacterium]